MDEFEVTKELWDDVAAWGAVNEYDISEADAAGKAMGHPAQMVALADCMKWCNARSERAELIPCYKVGGEVYKTGISHPECDPTANGYRLPTQQEWEYAARGGRKSSRFPWGDMIDHSRSNYEARPDYCSYDLSSLSGYHPDYWVEEIPYTSPVGSFAPNGYGLYDITGNVHEYTYSWDEDSPLYPPDLYYLRGGAFEAGTPYVRIAFVYVTELDAPYRNKGFRTVLSGEQRQNL